MAFAMSAPRLLRTFATLILLAASLSAQPPMGGRGGPMSETLRRAQELMRDGKFEDALAIYQKENANNQAGSLLDLMRRGAEARKYFQKAIDAPPDAAAKANAQRSMAMSYAFEGDCRNTVKYEEMVIAYWAAR